jgi:hypothetical protein
MFGRERERWGCCGILEERRRAADGTSDLVAERGYTYIITHGEGRSVRLDAVFQKSVVGS